MIRVFSRKTKWTPTDDLAFVGDPPLSLFRPPDQPVFISCTFTWDILEAERLKRSWQRFYSDVRVGGPAYGDHGEEFEPGRFIKTGVTITSRGCPKACNFCLVPEREGDLRELEIKPGTIIQDNNLLACSMAHIEKVFEMLSEQKTGATFAGGLDVDFFNSEHAEMLRSIKVRRLFFSCDYPGAVKKLEHVGELLSDFPRWKKYCYALIGFNGESVQQAEKRLKRIYDLGFMPFAQWYRPKTELKKEWISKSWSDLVRTFSRAAATKVYMKGA